MVKLAYKEGKLAGFFDCHAGLWFSGLSKLTPLNLAKLLDQAFSQTLYDYVS